MTVDDVTNFYAFSLLVNAVFAFIVMTMPVTMRGYKEFFVPWWRYAIFALIPFGLVLHLMRVRRDKV